MKTSETTPGTKRTVTTGAPTAAAPAKRLRAATTRNAARKPAQKRVPAAQPAPGPTLEDINRRAYEIYLSRNGQGDALGDWLQAEQELMARAS